MDDKIYQKRSGVRYLNSGQFDIPISSLVADICLKNDMFFVCSDSLHPHDLHINPDHMFTSSEVEMIINAIMRKQSKE